MGFFGWNQELEPKEPVSPIARDDDDYDREYTVEDHHSLPTDRAGITPDKYRTVFRLNIAAAVFQAASAGAIFALTATSDSGNDLSFYTNYPAAGDGGPVTSPNAVEAFKLNVGWLNGVFLGLSALDHLLVCTCFKGVYERQLSKNYNLFRWIEYAVSASIMRIVVGILSGLTDLHMQFLNFGLTAMTMIFGLVFELENKKNRLSEHNKVRWYLYWLGFIPHFFSWTVVMGYFFYSLSTGDPPGFVYAIIFIIFALDLSFAIVLGLQWLAKCCFRPYVNGEIAFIILSFTSKNLLAWINYFGATR
jgi:hypothetical protein